jgi:hypothetical protein
MVTRQHPSMTELLDESQGFVACRGAENWISLNRREAGGA